MQKLHYSKKKKPQIYRKYIYHFENSNYSEYEADLECGWVTRNKDALLHRLQKVLQVCMDDFGNRMTFQFI
jgi:hypothetical protein